MMMTTVMACLSVVIVTVACATAPVVAHALFDIAVVLIGVVVMLLFCIPAPVTASGECVSDFMCISVWLQLLLYFFACGY